MKKILYICPSAGVGGAETFIKQTFRHTDKEKFKNIYLLFNSGPLYDDLQAMGAEVLLLKKPPRLSRLSSHREVAKKIRDIINEYGIDLVHSTMSYGAIFGARVSKQMKVPHVWFQHGPVDGLMDRLASVLPHQGLIVNSHYTSQEQRALENPFRFLIPRKLPIEKILLGTDLAEPSSEETLQFRKHLLSRSNQQEQTVLIGMLCRIQKWKGVHLLADAVEKLQAKGVNNFHCFVWGESFKSDDYLKSLVDRAEKHNLNIQFMGPTKDVAHCLSAIDVIVNASINPEPFGLSIIEGMMMGAVPVVPDQGGPKEIVKHGQNGLHFKWGESDSLAKQLQTLIEDSALREKIAVESKNSAQVKFSAKRAITQLENFYKKILETK